MKIVPSKDHTGPHAGEYRLPEEISGRELNTVSFEENVTSLIKYMEFFSTMSFELEVDIFQPKYQKFLVPLLSMRNVYIS